MSKESKTLLAISRAGHDKGHLYLVVQEDDIWCVLVNGTTRPLAKPKKKKKIHLARIIHLDEQLSKETTLLKTDEDIHTFLSNYAMTRPNDMKV